MTADNQDVLDLSEAHAAELEQLIRRFDRAWRAGDRPAIDDYLPADPRQRRAALVELIHTDLEYRRATGEAARIEDYMSRYPELAEDGQVVRGLVATGPPTPGAGSTAGPGTGQSVEPLACLGRFELREVVGTGATSTVYRAIDPHLDRVVAIKVLRGGRHDSPEATDRFLREARSAAQLSHPGIVPVHDAGRADGTVYLVADLVAGPTLAERLRADRPGPRQAADLVAQVADALDYAHSKGVIHRDVKPSNILLDTDGRPRLTDFGLAKREAGEATVTQEGQVLGTPTYMSPEQARGEAHRVDARTDVYSLGVVLYELLTGEPPFRGNLRMVLAQVLDDDPRPPRRLNDQVPRDLERVCLKCLEKDPRRRYPSAAALAADLRRFLAGEPVKARPAGRPARLAKWARRRPSAAGLVAVSAASLAALLLGWLHFTLALRGERDYARTQEGLAKRNLYAAHMNLAQREWQSGRLERVLALLEEHRPRPGEPDLRGFEWYYLWRVCHQDLVLRGHDGIVNAVLFLPGGRLASAGVDGTLRVWDAATGQPLGVHRGHTESVTCLALAPGGALLATGSEDHTVRLWDTRTWAERAVLRGHTSVIRAVAFAPDGRTLASSGLDLQVKLWDPAAGRETATLLAMSPRPNPTTGKHIQQPVVALAFTPDGRQLLGGVMSGRVHFWDLAGGPQGNLRCEQASLLTDLAVSPDGRLLVTANEDATAKLWDLATLQERATLRGHTEQLSAVAFSPDGRRLATTGVDATVRLWEAEGGRLQSELRGHTGGVTSLAYSPDGRALATGGRDGTVRLWDPAGGRGLARPSGRPEAAWPGAGGPDRPPDRVQFQALGGAVFALAFDHRGATLAVGGRATQEVNNAAGEVSLWHLASGAPVARRQWQPATVRCLAFTPDDRHLAVGGILVRTGVGHRGLVTLWDPAADTERPFADPPRYSLWALAFSPDGRRLATASGNIGQAGDTHLWDVDAGRPVVTVPEEGEYVRALAVAPDGRTVAAVRGDGQITLWDGEMRERRHTFRAHTQRVFSVAFSPDGKTLASASRDGTARLWDVETGRLHATLHGHAQSVTAVAFAPDGSTLATASGDGTVKLWDPLTGQERLTFRADAGIPWALAFTPDGRTLAAGTERGFVLLWHADTEDGRPP